MSKPKKTIEESLTDLEKAVDEISDQELMTLVSKSKMDHDTHKRFSKIEKQLLDFTESLKTRVLRNKDNI